MTWQERCRKAYRQAEVEIQSKLEYSNTHVVAPVVVFAGVLAGHGELPQDPTGVYFL